MTKRMMKTLEPTKFANCPVIPVSAKPGGPEVKLHSRLILHKDKFVYLYVINKNMIMNISVKMI